MKLQSANDELTIDVFPPKSLKNRRGSLAWGASIKYGAPPFFIGGDEVAELHARRFLRA